MTWTERVYVTNSAVFHDWFGIFTISYPYLFSYVLHVCVAALILFLTVIFFNNKNKNNKDVNLDMIHQHMFLTNHCTNVANPTFLYTHHKYIRKYQYRTFHFRSELLESVKRIILSNVIAIVMNACVGYLTSKIHPMSWYSTPYLSFLLYGFPCLFSLLCCHLYFNYRQPIDTKFFTKNLDDYFLAANMLLWGSGLVLLSFVCNGMTFYVLYWCTAYLLIHCLRHTVIPLLQSWALRTKSTSVFFSKQKTSPFHPVRLMDILQNIILLLPLSVHFLILKEVLSVFVPIMGRSGTEVPSDIVIAIVIAFFLCLAFNCGVQYVYRIPVWFRWSLVLLTAAVFLGFMYTAMYGWSVYTDVAPKRVYIQHIVRKHLDGTGSTLSFFFLLDRIFVFTIHYFNCFFFLSTY
ncbi:hypothetical protein RFI_01666, partial [Reticulomyxa filosa]